MKTTPHQKSIYAQKRKKKTDNVVYFGIIFGIPFVISRDCNLDKINLGQKWKGTPKYKVRSESDQSYWKGVCF